MLSLLISVLNGRNVAGEVADIKRSVH